MTANVPAPQGMALGRETAVRLARMIRDFAASDVGYLAKLGLAALLGLLFAINGLNVVNSYVGRDFMTAIERRDGPAFVRQALVYLGVFGASTVAAVVYRFTEERLGLLWRNWLTDRLVTSYLDEHLYYHLAADGGLTNPDQRIADDVRVLVTSTLSLLLVFLNGFITLVAFSGVLWSISGPLFGVAVGYAATGSLLAIVLGRPLVRLNYDQADKEANLRAELIHVRENAESVALLGREPHLGARLRNDLAALVENLKRIIATNRNLGFFTTGYNYLIQIIPVLVVAPLFIRGEAEFGVIPQSAMAFAHVVGAFSLVVNQFPQLSSYAAVLARLSAFVDAVEAVAARRGGAIRVGEATGPLAIEHLTLRALQDGRILVADLSLAVVPGQRVLVDAADARTTTALLRAIDGLWAAGEGVVVHPPAGEVLLVPERPYLPPGTLRELLVGVAAGARSDAEVAAALETLDATAAVARVGGLDVERDWDDALSLEEQRRLDLARVLLAHPRVAVFERIAGGVGPASAARVLDALAAGRTGCLVLGADGLGPAGFDVVVTIAADGTWTRTATTEVA